MFFVSYTLFVTIGDNYVSLHFLLLIANAHLVLPEKNAQSKGRCKVEKLPFSTDCNIALLCLHLPHSCTEHRADLLPSGSDSHAP